MAYSTEIYKTWKKKQSQKYEQLTPIIKKHLNEQMTVIDIGIGPAWIYNYLKFKKIIGIDPDSKIIEPKKPFIEYHTTEQFKTKEKFDLLICFDTLHLIKEPKKILKYLKPNGIALISVPMHHKNLLKQFEDNTILEQGKIGQEEVDYFMLIQVD